MNRYILAEESFQNDFFDTEYLKADLAARSVRGGAVTMIAQGIKFFLQVGSLTVLARLLTPQDFGLIAMVTAVTGFVAMFKDMGLSMATIQKAEINHAQISTLFWINVILSLGIMLVTALLAPAIAWFYGEPRLTWITLALAGTFIFGGLTVQHQALLRRQMRFSALAVVEIISMSVGIVVGIIAAWSGASYWSLVLMQVITVIANAIAVWVACGWRPGLPKFRSGVQAMLAFGGSLAGFNVMNYFARNLDNVLIGWHWGSGQLGLYSKAYNLLLLPLRQINTPISNVAIPGLSSLQNQPERFRSYYIKTLSLVTFFTMPLAIVLAVLSKEIVQIILGPQWAPASNIFRFLAISILVQPICNTSGWLYIATCRTGQMFKWGSFGVSCVVASFFIGLPYGASGVALSYSCSVLLWALPCMYFATRGTSLTIKDIVKTVSHSSIAALAAGTAVMCGRYFVETSLPLWVGMLSSLLMLIGIYLLTVFYIFDKKNFYMSIAGLLKNSSV
jgi:O-antigen/teichoic acid export membrane protein